MGMGSLISIHLLYDWLFHFLGCNVIGRRSKDQCADLPTFAGKHYAIAILIERWRQLASDFSTCDGSPLQ